MSNDDTPSLYKMGANMDRVHAFRKEIEDAIGSVSDGTNDSTLWWTDLDYAANDKRIIDVLLDRIERISASYARDFI